MTLDIEALRLKTIEEVETARRSKKGLFLKGPIPLDWLVAAARLPGKALHVGQALWYVHGLRKIKTVKLSNQLLALFGVSRHAYSRCLTAMEEAKLVKVQRRSGKTPLVTILTEKALLEGGPHPDQGSPGS